MNKLSNEHFLFSFSLQEGIKPIYDEIRKHYNGVQGMAEEFLTSERETMASTLAYIDEM